MAGIKIYEATILDALYLISPTGIKNLSDYLEQKYGAFDVDSMNTALARLVQKGAIISHMIEGITLWGLPGTWAG